MSAMNLPKKTTTGRNAAAVAAHFRNSAGAMKDKRAARGGARNDSRDFMLDLDEAREIEEELESPPAGVLENLCAKPAPSSFYDDTDGDDDYSVWSTPFAEEDDYFDSYPYDY